MLPQNFTIDYEIDKKIYNKKFSRIEKEESDSVGRNKIFSLTENGIRSVDIDHEKVMLLAILSFNRNYSKIYMFLEIRFVQGNKW